MTTRRNFLKTGSISLAGLLVGEKVYSAVRPTIKRVLARSPLR